MNPKDLSTIVLSLGIATSLAFVHTATADLIGTDVNVVSEYTDSPFLEGGSWNDLGNFQVGDGVEWSSGVLDVFDYTNPSNIVGTMQFDLDIGDDYIALTTTWTNYEVNNDWTFLSLLPGEFYGYHLSWDSPVDIVSASLSVSGNPVNMGDLNLYENINPALEDWVDLWIDDPQSDDRITITENGLDINMQGIAWEYFNETGSTYSQTAMIDLTFVPSPGVFALLGVAALRRRRRS